MARKSFTTITDSDLNAFMASAEYRQELACERIRGFHLQKLARDGSWRFRYRGLDDKYKIINIGKLSFLDRIEAAKIAVQLENDVDRGHDPIFEREKRREQQRIEQLKAQNSTLRAFWSTTYTDTKRKAPEGVAAINRIHYHFHLIHDLFDRQLHSLSRADVHAWQRKCWDFECPQTGKQKQLAHSTIQRTFNALKTLLNMAVEESVITHNPLTHPQRVKLLDPPTKAQDASESIKRLNARRALTETELNAIRRGVDAYREQRRAQRLRSAAKGREIAKRYCQSEDDHPDWFFPFLELAAYSGCAPGDLYTLTWHELLLDIRRLTYTRNKTYHKAIKASKEPLTVNLPLNDRITRIMRTWHRQMGSPTSGLVFPSEVTGKAMSKDAHTKHWAHVKRLGGVPDELQFYSFRHHFISTRIAANIPMFEVARLVGQKSTKMIEEHYGHLAPNAAEKAMANELDTFGNGETNEKQRGVL